MVIDDNEANIALLRALLQRAGLRHIFTFSDPRVAVTSLEQVNPDMVMLDLHMPHLDGFEVLDAITQHAAGSYLPVLVLTADSTQEATHKALGLGARDFITKPFDASEVVLRVRNLLETQTLYQTIRGYNRRLRDQLDVYHSLEQLERETLQNRREKIEAILNRDRLTMHFQPIFELSTSHIVGVEALARFSDSSLRPDQWFALASSVGLGPELEMMAIRSALGEVASLPDSTFVALNISPGSLLHPEFQDLFSEEFCDRVILELTEHVAVEDYEVIAQAMRPFRDRGMRLAADDTGAGYAGFLHLLSLDPDIIKLDISLVRDIHTDPARRALATALVSFATDTNRLLVAEGIENQDELETVRELSVHWGQGFHLARPLTAPALHELMAKP
jgi:EAL domain-containing protein (putative c-di-GMP-specific phosphodiesterase class I)